MRPIRALSLTALLALAAPLGATTAELTLFRDRNFKGPTVQLKEADSNVVFSPRSVRLTGGPWIICARPFFGGRCDEVSASNGNLRLHRGFSGTVRSARPVALPAPPMPEPRVSAPKAPEAAPPEAPKEEAKPPAKP